MHLLDMSHSKIKPKLRVWLRVWVVLLLFPQVWGETFVTGSLIVLHDLERLIIADILQLSVVLLPVLHLRDSVADEHSVRRLLDSHSLATTSENCTKNRLIINSVIATFEMKFNCDEEDSIMLERRVENLRAQTRISWHASDRSRAVLDRLKMTETCTLNIYNTGHFDIPTSRAIANLKSPWKHSRFSTHCIRVCRRISMVCAILTSCISLNKPFCYKIRVLMYGKTALWWPPKFYAVQLSTMYKLYGCPSYFAIRHKTFSLSAKQLDLGTLRKQNWSCPICLWQCSRALKGFLVMFAGPDWARVPSYVYMSFAASQNAKY